MSGFRMRCRRGLGIVVLIVMVTLFVLCGAVALARYGRSVRRQAYLQDRGRQALYAARTAVAEASRTFKDQVNEPGTAWFCSVRKEHWARESLRRWIQEDLDPVLTRGRHARSGLTVRPVRVSVWRDVPFKTTATLDEWYALLTLTADVVEDSFRARAPRTRRLFQESYEVKQVLVVPPPPLGRQALYVNDLPLLEQQRIAYDRILTSLGSRSLEVETFYRAEIDRVVAILETYLEWLRAKVADLDDTLSLVARTHEKKDWAEGLLPLSMGLATPAVTEIRKTLADLESGLDQDLARTLEIFGFPDEETLRRVARDPYPPARLREDISFVLSRGEWPAFRGHRATPAGVEEAGSDLTMPLVSIRPSVSTTELMLRFPDPPALPSRPRYRMDPAGIEWTDRYASITRTFRDYMQRHDRHLGEFAARIDQELARHEAAFRLLSFRPAEYANELDDFHGHSRKASRFFDGERALLSTRVARDGTLAVDGIDAVRGDLVLTANRYAGRGVLVVEGQVRIGSLHRTRATDTLMIIAGGDVRIEGPVEASVVAPRGSIRGTSSRALLEQAILQRIVHGDDFEVVLNPAFADEGPGSLWLTTAPVPAAAVVRRY